MPNNRSVMVRSRHNDKLPEPTANLQSTRSKRAVSDKAQVGPEIKIESDDLIYTSNAGFTHPTSNDIPNSSTSYQHKKRKLEKKNLTLDLKKAKETPSNIPPGIALLSPITTTAGVLNSPDVQMLSLNSPQIEKFLLTGSLPTPKGTSPMLFPSNSTNLDKQKFEKGFNDALAKAHAANAPGQAPLMMGYIPAGGVIIGNPANMNPNSLAFNNPNTTIPSSQPQLVVFNGFHNSMPQQQQQTQHQQQQQHQPQQINRIKSENDGPVRAESTHSTASSTNMGSDDYHTQSGENTMDGDDKIEKKRLRNRIAAQKCRQRKLQRISELEVKVHELNVENKKLEDEGSLLRNQLNELKHTLDQHSKAGCVLD